MNSMILEWLKFIGALVALSTAAFIAYSKVREKRLAGEHGLEDNPERCGRHEEAITTLKGKIDNLDEKNTADHGQIFAHLQNLSLELVGIKKDLERREK